ncbi:MAG TPA: hypothetical protein V6D26_03845 [Stenomitos sp.]
MSQPLYDIKALQRIGLTALAILLLAACGNPDATKAEFVTQDKNACGLGGSMSQIPAVPEGVLLQVLLLDSHERESGYRIYGDGRYESHPLGKSWTLGSPLTPQQLEAVQTAIAQTGLERLQSIYRPTNSLSDDSNNVLWTQFADNQGTIRSIAVVQPCKVPEIDSLNARLVELFKSRGNPKL